MLVKFKIVGKNKIGDRALNKQYVTSVADAGTNCLVTMTDGKVWLVQGTYDEVIALLS